MSCYTYTVNGTRIKFEDLNDKTPCVCTFPHSDAPIDKDILRSLAHLGAATHLCQSMQFTEPYFYIPQDIPDDVRKLIDYCIDNEVRQ